VKVAKRQRPRTMTLRETKSRVLITRHGRPAAVIIGVEGVDLLDVVQRFAGLS
jgi:hypothetical protein